MEKDYFVPFASYGEDKFEEKRSKFPDGCGTLKPPKRR